MGARGPQPIPNEVLKIRNSRHIEKRPETVSHTTIARPRAPSWLTRKAKADWDYIVPLLLDAGLLTKIDRDVLAMHCQSFVNYVALEKRVQAAEPDPPPGLIRRRNEERDAAIKTCREFGLSPSARVRVRAEKKEIAPDDKARFFAAS
jgi:phage terminase small subunit